jgi:hypothetical protein
VHKAVVLTAIPRLREELNTRSKTHSLDFTAYDDWAVECFFMHLHGLSASPMRGFLQLSSSLMAVIDLAILASQVHAHCAIQITTGACCFIGDEKVLQSKNLCHGIGGKTTAEFDNF